MSRTSRFVLPALAAVAGLALSLPRCPGRRSPRLSPRAKARPNIEVCFSGHDGQHGRADRRGQSENLGHLQPVAAASRRPTSKSASRLSRQATSTYPIHDLT